MGTSRRTGRLVVGDRSHWGEGFVSVSFGSAGLLGGRASLGLRVWESEPDHCLAGARSHLCSGLAATHVGDFHIDRRHPRAARVKLAFSGGRTRGTWARSSANARQRPASYAPPHEADRFPREGRQHSSQRAHCAPHQSAPIRCEAVESGALHIHRFRCHGVGKPGNHAICGISRPYTNMCSVTSQGHSHAEGPSALTLSGSCSMLWYGLASRRRALPSGHRCPGRPGLTEGATLSILQRLRRPRWLLSHRRWLELTLRATRSIVRTVGAAEKQWTIRPATPVDRDEAVRFLQRAFGHTKITPALWDWLFVQNPGNAGMFYFVADHDGRIVGQYPTVPVRLRHHGEEALGLLGLHTATDPEYGGQGIFSALFRRVCEEAAGKARFVYGFPNENFGPIYYSRLGWVEVRPYPLMHRVIGMAGHGTPRRAASKTIELALRPLLWRARSYAAYHQIEPFERFDKWADDIWQARADKSAPPRFAMPRSSTGGSSTLRRPMTVGPRCRATSRSHSSLPLARSIAYR